MPAEDSSMTVGVVGDGPAVEAVEAALSDVSVAVQRGNASILSDVEFGIVVGLSGGSVLAEANQVASDTSTRWLGVEVGGVGGAPTEGGGMVGAFAPDGPCYECLRRRVAATTDETVSDPTATRSVVRYAGALAGRLSVEWLGGDDLAGTVVSLPETHRVLLPDPGCPTCDSGHDWRFTLTYRDRSVEAAANMAERAVDDRLGPIQAVGERESYPAAYYLAQFVPSPHGNEDIPAQAAGVAADWDAAYMKALGEAMERYSAGVYQDDWFVETPATLTNPIGDEEFTGTDESDTHETTSRWVPGRSLHEDTPVHLPADRVVFPPPDETIHDPITTGLGLGSSTVEAVISGLTEVLERDATMCAWYSTYEPVGLEVHDDAYNELAMRARSEDLSVTATLVTGDVDIPVVAATVTREEWPRFAAGSAAALDAERAARSALEEALQNWMELRALGRDDASQAGTAVARYADDPEPVAELTEPEPVLSARDVGSEDPPKGKDALEAILERTATSGLTAYAARITARDVAAVGFEAVRVLVPRAQPLFVSSPVFGARARSVPRSLGYEPRLDRSFHPYP
jgi:ribosomal protein S12 methylthiotransferase accessory factor